MTVAAYILAAWFVGLTVAFTLWCALAMAKQADETIAALDAPSMGDEVQEAVVFEFPQRRPGGGWVA